MRFLSLSSRRSVSFLLGLAFVSLSIAPANAGIFRPRRQRPQAVYQAVQVNCPGGVCAQVAVGQTTDPAAFLGWLNATRAGYKLSAVGYDQNLANWAAANNVQQNARGIGHYVMGPSRVQNAAWTPGGQSLSGLWMNSPAHRAALLDPSIRVIGLAGSGSYWTFNAY